MRRKELNAELWQLLKRKNNLQYKKSREKWIREGDTNSKFFHNAINFKRKRNGIHGLLVNDNWIEGVNEVREEVYNHFSKQFSDTEWNRPTLEGISFKQLSDMENLSLIKPFTVEEIKDAVWTCGKW